MKNTYFFGLSLLMSFAFINCKSTASIVEVRNLKETVSKQKFVITAKNASPVAFVNVRGIDNLLPFGSNLASINLSMNDNILKVKNDSLQLNMPYYGEQHIAKGYGTSGNFEFDGIPDTFTSKFDDKENSYFLEYWLDTTEENLRIGITLFANNSCRFTINSSNRTTISYNGSWKVLKE